MSWLTTWRPTCVWVRMARVNISLPDDLHRQARAAGHNISQLTRGAGAAELDRRAKLAELGAYLQELESELGPVPAAKRAGHRGMGR